MFTMFKKKLVAKELPKNGLLKHADYRSDESYETLFTPEIEPVTPVQIDLAEYCGISIKGCSRKEAVALLHVELGDAISHYYPRTPTTEAQINYAKRLNVKNLSPIRAKAIDQISAAEERRKDASRLERRSMKEKIKRFLPSL